MFQISKTIKNIAFIFGVVALSLGLGYAVLAWTEPSLVPPGCVSGTPGCDAPLNVSAALQTKQGQLVVNANSLLNPGLLVNNDAYFLNGNVGIGTTAPRTKLELGNDGAILAIGAYNSGWTEPNMGAGTRMIWYPRKAAFRAGAAFGAEWNDANIGLFSFGSGASSTAKGEYSTAMGYYSFADGRISIATGYWTRASGDYSTAMGRQTVASGDYATALGYLSNANGTASTAMGEETQADGYASTAMGGQSIAIGDYSTAIGWFTTAGADYSYALGKGASATQPLINSTQNSLMVGFNSTIPTLFVGPSAGVGTTGNVGIGTTTPMSTLDVAGSARFSGSATSVLTGSIDPVASATVTGVGTLFTTELVPGDEIIVSGERRVVQSIASNTSLVVYAPFSDNANDTSPDKLPAGLMAEIPSGNSRIALNEDGLYIKANNVVIDEGSPELYFVDSSTADVGWRFGGGTGNYFSIKSVTNANKEVGASSNWDMIFRYVPGGTPTTGSTNIGIGTGGSPGAKLDVNGNVKIGRGAVQANKALCWMADKTIGYCSTQPDATGSCTCNAIN